MRQPLRAETGRFALSIARAKKATVSTVSLIARCQIPGCAGIAIRPMSKNMPVRFDTWGSVGTVSPLPIKGRSIQRLLINTAANSSCRFAAPAQSRADLELLQSHMRSPAFTFRTWIGSLAWSFNAS